MYLVGAPVSDTSWVSGIWYRLLGTKYLVLDTRYHVLGVYPVLGTKCQAPGTGTWYQAPGA